MEGELIESEVEQTSLTKDTACPSLPEKFLKTGFCVGFLLGTLISVLGVMLFIYKICLEVYVFASLFTLGNICSLLSTLFLFGPKKQFKYMFQIKRIFATILCLICIVFIFVFCLAIYDNENGIHKIVLWCLVLVQYFSMYWYILSYFPCKKSR